MVGAAVAVETGADAGPVVRPALRAWNTAHERERRRMGLVTQDAYAQWIGVDPGNWSKWRRGRRPVPGPEGRRIAALLVHDPRWPGLWLRLVQEQELLALEEERAAPGPRARGLRLVGAGERPPLQG